MVQRQSALAAQYQQVNAQKAQQLTPRAQSLHGNDNANRNANRTQTHSALSYSTTTNTDSKCPFCSGDHTFTNQAGKTRSGTRLMDCAEGYMKKTAEERSNVIEEVKGCRFCTSYKHASELCHMPCKFPCAKQDGDSVCGKDHHSSLYGSKPKYCKGMSVNVQKA